MPKKIMLACNICKSKNYNVGKSIEARLQVKKFCKYCNRHVLHKEEK